MNTCISFPVVNDGFALRKQHQQIDGQQKNNKIFKSAVESLTSATSSLNTANDMIEKLNDNFTDLQKKVAQAHDLHESLVKGTDQLQGRKDELLADITKLTLEKSALMQDKVKNLLSQDQDETQVFGSLESSDHDMDIPMAWDDSEEEEEDDSQRTDVGNDGQKVSTDVASEMEADYESVDDSITSTFAKPNKKHRRSKVYSGMSPKKWRRMMKTQRLQSISLE